MAELIIDKFHAGLVTHPSETELPPGAALKAEDVEFSALGKLKSRKGYRLEFAGPSGITIIGDPFKYEFNLPGSFGRKEVIFIYGQDGSSRDTLWWRPYWDTITAAWIDAWQELTEFEGPYTTDTNTTTSEIEATAGELDNQATDEYYTGWTLVNITRQSSMVIGDYTASTRILGHKANLTIASQASGDLYMLYRFPLFMTVEGPYTTDSSPVTTATVLYDKELRVDVTDYYKDWIVRNTTRSAQGTVTAYDGVKRKLTHGSIAGQVGENTYYIYTTAHNIRVNSEKVRFFPRENEIEISLGNDEEFPLKAPLWFGFIKKRWYFNNEIAAMGDTEFEGFLLVRNVMETPDVSSLTLTDLGSGTLADDEYFFKRSYLYDGYQEGPLSESSSLNPSGTNRIGFAQNIPFWSSDPTHKPGFLDAIFNKRITHEKLYATKGTIGDVKDDYFLIEERIITNDELDFSSVGGVPWTSIVAKTFGHGAISFDDDLWLGVTYLRQAGLLRGKNQRWNIEQGHKSKRVDANFKFRTTLEEQHYKAPLFIDRKRDAFVGYSVQANGLGTPVDDVLPQENFINLSQKGIVEITGEATIRGFLVILTPNKIFVYTPGRSLTDIPVARGNIAERGFIEIDDILYITASDDFYAFDGSLPRKLMFGKILDKWQAISDANKQSAFVGYSGITDSIFLVAGGTIFVYDRIFDAWRTHTTDVTFIGFTTRRDGVLFAATSSNIYELQSGSFTEVLTTDWESRIFDFAKELGDSRLPIAADVNKLIMKYDGDKRIKVSLFDPSQSNVYPMATVVFFPIASNTKPKPVPRVVSFEANQLQVKIEDIDPGTSQPSSEIDYLRIEYEPISGES